jgi:transcriptional regulator with PAS, ATPase and Fis domain
LALFEKAKGITNGSDKHRAILPLIVRGSQGDTKMGMHKIRKLTPTKAVRIRVGTTLVKAEEMLVKQALEASNHNYEFAAELLGVSSQTVSNLHKGFSKK